MMTFPFNIILLAALCGFSGMSAKAWSARSIINISYQNEKSQMAIFFKKTLAENWLVPQSFIQLTPIEVPCRNIKARQEQELLHLCMDNERNDFIVLYQDAENLKKLFMHWPMPVKGE